MPEDDIVSNPFQSPVHGLGAPALVSHYVQGHRKEGIFL